MAMTVRASIRRHANDVSPGMPTDADVLAGGRHYFDGCAGCHGTPGKPRREREGFLPPPYLPTNRSQLTEPQIFWIVKHGVRRTGMSAYGPFFKENELWQLAAFVKRMPDIPPAVLDSLGRQ
jgi:mono/diheme cytochrome c family protein